MNKSLKIFVLLFLSLAVFFSSQSIEVSASTVLNMAGPEAQISSRKLDKEARILKAYLRKYHSPMEEYAQDFIDASRLYNLDWKMLLAIAGVESTFGKQTPGGYNAYGWGVYGANAIYFDSWTDGVYTVAKGLREGYLDKGLTDPHSINKVYAASKHWGGNVAYFMNDLEKFALLYTEENIKENLSKISSEPKVAAVSGLVVVR